MAMTITPTSLLRAQANVLTGQSQEGPTPRTFGFAAAGDHRSANVVWTSTVTLPQNTGVSFELDGTYTKTGAPTVTDGLLNGTDLSGAALPAGLNAYTFGVRVTGNEAYAATAGYAVYFGRYTGAIADWAPTGAANVGTFEQVLGPKNAVVMNVTGLGGNGVGMQREDWVLYNFAAQTMTVEIFVEGQS